eukprot:TRINITY_DN3271_c0_g2_i13.p1 TRINITY_DN3271_c0_g2~~TRINITY_DN3271_c0_g2_i13.p1  ORF type:complete len:165 (+),score=37.41 TRINITY_DN3271_c0_g2_i13:1099-1593(+)
MPQFLSMEIIFPFPLVPKKLWMESVSFTGGKKEWGEEIKNVLTQKKKKKKKKKKYSALIPLLGFSVFTSNVDGHFQKAGFPENNIIECHGSIHFIQEDDGIKPATNINILIDPHTMKAQNVPRDKNGNVLRPNILMFGDWDWNSQSLVSFFAIFGKAKGGGGSR